MKKNIAIITLAFVLGLFCCNLVSAQVYRPPVIPGILGQLKYQTPQAQPATQPSINPRLLRDLSTTPNFSQRDRDLLGNINLRPIPQSNLNLPPGFNLRPVDPPQGLLPSPLPPGMLPSPLPPQPLPTPQPPVPQPQPQGPTIQFGPGGPSVSFGSGPHINIPVGQIVDRIRERRGFQTPTQVNGYGPNGQIHTGDATVHGSTFTPGRNLSQHNGTQQQVQQPIYDQFGNLTGYQTGTVWQNSITGQQHGNMTRYTPNGTGGVHQSTTLYSTAGGNNTPIGN